MYYGNAVTAQKVDVVVIRNDNKSNVKTIKANVTSFPASIEVTGTQLTTLFDSTINLGDKFEIGADVTTITGKNLRLFRLQEILMVPIHPFCPVQVFQSCILLPVRLIFLHLADGIR